MGFRAKMDPWPNSIFHLFKDEIKNKKTGNVTEKEPLGIDT